MRHADAGQDSSCQRSPPLPAGSNKKLQARKRNCYGSAYAPFVFWIRERGGMKYNTKTEKFCKWFVICFFLFFFFYAVYFFLDAYLGSTIYPNYVNFVGSFEKVKRELKDKDYIYPDLSGYASCEKEFALYMDGSSYGSKALTYSIRIEYPHEPYDIGFSINTELSAYSERVSPQVAAQAARTQTEYSGTQIVIKRQRNDDAVYLDFNFTLGESHYCIYGRYGLYAEPAPDRYPWLSLDFYTKKSGEPEVMLTEEEQREAEGILCAEIGKITRQMIDDYWRQ